VTSPGGLPAASVVDGVDVDALRNAVCACPAVSDLSGGLLGSVGTYLPGRRVIGIVVRSVPGGVTEVEVHVVARWGATMAEVAAEVRAAAAPLAPGAVVSVTIEDIAAPLDTAISAGLTPSGG
jgi:hypothetical protein